MPHDYFEKEVPNDYEEIRLNRISHPFDGKYIEIETIRNNNSLKRRTHSKKCMQQHVKQQT